MRTSHPVKGTKPIRLISRKSNRHFNIVQNGIPVDSQIADIYHVMLEWTWWQLTLLFTAVYFIIHVFFGLLFFADSNGIFGTDESDSGIKRFYLAFCFSVQTLSTVGYGTPLAPKSLYVQTMVIIESYFSILFIAVLTAFIVSKLQRPTRIGRNVIFSNVAVVNQVTSDFIDDPAYPAKGYFDVGQFPSLIVRCANVRRPLLISSSVKLLLLRRETMDGRTLPKVLEDYGGEVPDDIRFVLRMHELDFELFQQYGRPRQLNYSTPQLPLPWTLTHTINPVSPLWGLSQASLQDPNNLFEIIVVVDGVDEAVSMNVQARYSYLQSDIKWNTYFVPMVRPNYETGKYEVNYEVLSSYVELDQVKVDSNLNTIIPESTDLVESRRSVSLDYAMRKPMH
eukprot:TRINITY_DN3755_c0_g1_i1.p1 TRINITY_DN3755_c0_g1~~TRINITY_DN3755_c0_g1_i1.p1  ORF type:complete len:395 (-),score=99.26 TRINITY_DN3755_c0_g1_i1:226-1410(-)